MATRSTIAVQLANGQVRQVYCHWDGYLDNNGQLLEQFYNSQSQAEAITSLGDISSLREQITPLGTTHTFDSPEKDVTIFYGRDRGETEVDPQLFDSYTDYVANARQEEYDYIFQNGEWLVRSYATQGEQVTLADAALAEQEVA
jgi:hypothetical protein